jgi:3-oxoacyl-[acyl-carrier protein] reductase
MRVAVITGASRGLGREISVTLGKAGYNVAINYNGSPKKAEEVVRLVGERSFAIKADVGNIHEVQAMSREVSKRWGRVDALINNAGITRDGLLINYPEDDWDEVMRVNLKGCFNTVKSFAPLMVESGGGHIVNISSRSSKGKSGQTGYSTSKASILGLTFTLARELSEYNIRVNSVLPGYMATEMGMKAKKAMREAMQESIMGCLSSIEEVSGFVANLLSTKNITGQAFCLDSRI